MNAKSVSMVIRVEESDKEAIQHAAAQSGKSLSKFVLDAATKAAAKVEKAEPPRGVHRGVPSYFKGWCFTASQGGAFGYEDVGYELLRKVGSEQPYDIEEDEWYDEIDVLANLIFDGDAEAVLSWFERHYPRMMEWIPKRRREQFMAGVNLAYEEHGLEV